jgi:hypothetical protein
MKKGTAKRGKELSAEYIFCGMKVKGATSNNAVKQKTVAPIAIAIGKLVAKKTINKTLKTRASTITSPLPLYFM